MSTDKVLSQNQVLGDLFGNELELSPQEQLEEELRALRTDELARRLSGDELRAVRSRKAGIKAELRALSLQEDPQSRCPVNHGRGGGSDSGAAANASAEAEGERGCPVMLGGGGGGGGDAASSEGCPVMHKGAASGGKADQPTVMPGLNPHTMMYPADQRRAKGQTVVLSTERKSSTINKVRGQSDSQSAASSSRQAPAGAQKLPT
jgi:hypothetical protein